MRGNHFNELFGGKGRIEGLQFAGLPPLLEVTGEQAMGSHHSGLEKLFAHNWKALRFRKAELSGFVMSYGGLAIVICMPLVGVLGGKLDNRYLAAFGFLVTGITTWAMYNMNLRMSFNYAAGNSVVSQVIYCPSICRNINVCSSCSPVPENRPIRRLALFWLPGGCMRDRAGVLAFRDNTDWGA